MRGALEFGLRNWVLRGAFIVFASYLYADPIAVKQRQKEMLSAVYLELQTHYGMIQYKEQLFGQHLYDQSRRHYESLIDRALLPEEEEGLVEAPKREALSREEFDQLLIALAADFQDGHFNILRNSKDYWTTGLQVASLKRRLYIVGFSEDYYQAETSSEALKVGDEIIEIDGISVEELAKRNMPYSQRATFETRWQWAQESLLQVSHRFLPAKETAKVVALKIHRNTGKEEPQTIYSRLQWINVKDHRQLQDIFSHLQPKKDESKIEEKPYVFGERTTRSYFKEGLKKTDLPEGSVIEIGQLYNQELEKLKATAKVKPVTHLEAYMVHYEGKNYGVIRIPDYSPGSIDEVENEYAWLGNILQRMQNTTEALVIDQLNNGGGYVWAVTQFARLFVNKPVFDAVSINIKLNRTFLNGQENEIQDTGVDKVNFARVRLSQILSEKMKQKFARGEEWSGPLPYEGTTLESTEGEFGKIFTGKFKPYTKPILFLVDSRSGSGGDFMPAIMQINQRALIMGETSMGLGGPVYRSTSTLPGSELNMRCTFGYCKRADGLSIENIGVLPDIVREVDSSDISKGFAGYSNEVLQTIKNWAEGKSKIEIEKILKDKTSLNDKEKALQDEISRREAEMFAVDSQTKSLPVLMSLESFMNWLIEQQKELGSSWKQVLILDLPQELRDLDPILPTLKSFAAVLDRMKQMLYLFSGNREALTPKQRAFLASYQVILPHMKRMKLEFRHRRCEDLLKK